MPQLAALDKRYGKKGLQLIGVHRQTGTDEQILKPIKDARIRFPIARTGGSPVPGDGGIPYMYVFNPKGELIFHGRGPDAEKAIKREMRQLSAGDEDEEDSAFAPNKDGPLVAERTWTSVDGRTLVATLLSVEGPAGKFKRPDGTSFSLPLDRLAEADRKLITDAQAAPKEAGDGKK